MGHSNGAIAAVQAATIDVNAVGVLGLDAVEAMGADHTQQAALLSVPAYGLFGESDQCNDSNSGLAVFKNAPTNINLRVAEAGHCDFEAPTDALCELAPGCDGPNSQFTEESIQNTILNLGTSFIRWRLSQDADAETWWTAGEQGYESLLTSGSIQPL